MANNLVGKLVATAASHADPVAQADLAWFTAHEGRLFRLRDPAPLEFKAPLGDPGDGFSWRVLVARLADGRRLRLPVSLAWDLHNDHAKDQHLRMIFDQVAPEKAKALLKK
jgi:hypothetical protein